MPDGIIEGDIEITGVAEAIQSLQRVKLELESIHGVHSVVEVDTTKATESIAVTQAAMKRIQAEAAAGIQASIADVQRLSQALSNAYRAQQIEQTRGPTIASDILNDKAVLHLETLKNLKDSVLKNLADIDTAEAAREAKANERLKATMARMVEEAKASAARKAQIIADNQEIIASNDAVATSNTRASRIRAIAAGQAAPSMQPAVVDWTQTENATQQRAREAAQTQRVLAINPGDSPEVIARKKQLAEVERLQLESEKRLEDNSAASTIRTRQEYIKQATAFAAEFDAQQAKLKEIGDKYYRTDVPGRTAAQQRYASTKPATPLQDIETEYQRRLAEPIDQTLRGAPAINAAVSQRATSATTWRAQQIAEINRQNEAVQAQMVKDSELARAQSDQAATEFFRKYGYTSPVAGPAPGDFGITQQEASVRHSSTAQSYGQLGTWPDDAHIQQLNAQAVARQQATNSQARMPKRGDAAARYGRRYGRVLPQSELDANFAQDLLDNPPPFIAPGTTAREMVAQQTADRAKAVQDQADLIRRTRDLNQWATGGSDSNTGRFSPWSPTIAQARGNGPAPQVTAATETTTKVAEETAKQTAVVTEAEAAQTAAVVKAAEEQWIAKKVASDRSIEQFRAEMREAQAARDIQVTEMQAAQRRATSLAKKSEKPGATYLDRAQSADANEFLISMKQQTRDAAEEANNAKAQYEEVTRSARQQGLSDSFSAGRDPFTGLPVEGGGGRGGGGRGPVPIWNTQFAGSSSEDVIRQMRTFQDAATSFREAGGQVNAKVEALGGFPTETELREVSNALHQLTGTAGKGTIFASSVGADQGVRQADAMRRVAGEPQFANIAYMADTTGQAEANRLAKEATAARLEARNAAKEESFVVSESAAIKKQSAVEEKQYIQAATAARRDNEKAIRDQNKAVADLKKVNDAAAAETAAADKARLQPFSQTGNTQSRSILGVPLALAGPAVLGGGVALATKEATDYQTLLIETANQTNLTTAAIKIMDDTIRQTPTGNMNLDQLALGFKNITDLGYSASDAQRIETEESKAASAAGADQATVMLAITSSMKDYNAQAQDVAKFTNTTVEAARLANSTFDNWSSTTRRATAIAAAYKVPLAEVDAMLVALTRHGFNTAQANTQVAGLVQNVIAPTPAAERELKSLSDKTGIDLIGDFSQTGAQAKGFRGILDDLAKATNGDEAEIRRLIPALRGGQAALLLSTTASVDFKSALEQLGQTVDGSLKPVDEGFDRIKNTLGFQFGAAMKQAKLDIIDVGAAFTPTATTMVQVLNMIPPGLQQTIIEFGLVVLAAKALAIGLGFVEAGAAKYAAANLAAAQAQAAVTAAARTATATVTEQDAALIANTANVDANTLSWRTNAVARDTALFPTGGKVATAAAEGTVLTAGTMAVEAGFAAKVAAAISKAAKAIGVIAVPVTIGLAVGKITADAIDQPVLDAIAKATGHKTLQQRADANPDVQTADQQILDIANIPDPAEAVRVGKKYLDSIDEQIQAYKNSKNNSRNPFDSTNANADLIVNTLMNRSAKAQAAIDNRLAGLDPTARQKALATSDPNAPPDDAQAAQDAQDAAIIDTQRRDLLAKGAPERLVNVALNPDDFGGLTTKDVEQAKKDLAEWQKQYDAVQTAAKNAQTALNGIDLSKGIAELVKDSDQLQKIQTELKKVGESSPAFDNLTSLAMKFKDIQSAEDAARTAYDGFLLTLDETDRRVQVLEALKNRITNAVAAAQLSVDRGTGTDAERQLLKNAPNMIGNINKDEATLNRNGVPDVMGLAGNVPDYPGFDALTRAAVTGAGGGTKVEITLHDNVDSEKARIQALVEGPWTAFIDLNTRPTAGVPWLPPGNPATTSYDNTNGDNNNGVGPPPPPAGSAVGVGANPNLHTGGYNRYQPIDWNEYSRIVPKNSPLYDPTVLASLNEEAKKGNIDPRFLLAFNRQEGNFETAPGTAWQREDNNPGGLKFDNQQGARPGASAPADEGSTPYANFNSYGDYYRAMVKTLTGYDAYKNNDPAGVVGDWTKGPRGYAALSPEEQAAVANSKLDYYRQYRTGTSADPYNGYDAGQPGGGIGTGGLNTQYQQAIGQPGGGDLRMPWRMPIDAPYKITQGPFDASGSHANLGAYDLAIPTGTRINSVGQGTVTESGWSNAGYGNSVVVDYGQGINARYGHLSSIDDNVKVGSRVQGGEELGLSGSTGNSTGPHLHFEVTVNGKEVDPKSIGFNFDDPAHMGMSPTATGPTNQPGSKSITNPVEDAYKVTPMYDATMQSRVLAANLSMLAPQFLGHNQGFLGTQDLSRVTSQTSQFSQYARSYYENRPEFAGNKTGADNKADEATLNFATAYSKAMADVRTSTGLTRADMDAIRATGGAVADNTIAWLQAQQKINEATTVNGQAQAEMKAIDDKQFNDGIARAAADRSIAAMLLTQSRTNEDTDISDAAAKLKRDRKTEDDRVKTQITFQNRQNKITNETNTENDAYIPIQQKFQDRQRTLQFNQQVGSTDIQNKITDLQKQQALTNYNQTSGEQLLGKEAAGAGSNIEQGKLSAALALQHEGDLARKDANTKALDDLQLLARQQAKKDNLESFNLETETIAAQRAHDSRLHDIDVESRTLAIDQQNSARRQAADDLKTRRNDEDEALRKAALRLEQKRIDEDAAIRLANQRADEDQANAIRKKQLQDTIDKNTELITGLQQYQSYLDSIQSEWSSIANFAGDSANGISNALGMGPAGNVTPIPPKAPAHAFGISMIPMNEPFSVVGDRNGQITDTTEVIHAPGLAVTNLRQLMATPPAGSQPASSPLSMPLSVTLEDQGNDEALIAQLHNLFDKRLREAMIEVRSYQRKVRNSRGVA